MHERQPRGTRVERVLAQARERVAKPERAQARREERRPDHDADRSGEQAERMHGTLSVEVHGAGVIGAVTEGP